MPTVHPTVTIDLSAYGREGVIIISEPTMARVDRMEECMLSRFLTLEQRDEYDQLPTRKREEYLKPFIRRHLNIYSLMQMYSHMESSPWDTFDDFIDEATYDMVWEILQAMKRLKEKNPFAVIDEYHEYQMGMELFNSGIKDGTRDPTLAYYIAYAQFLQNHSKSEWEEMTDTDIAMFVAYRRSYDTRHDDNLSNKIANGVGRVFGAEEEHRA